MNAESIGADCPIVLVGETVRFGGMILDYRLIAYPTQNERFHVRISTGRETAESVVGSDIEHALRIYRILLGGRVTPCGLAEVLHCSRLS